MTNKFTCSLCGQVFSFSGDIPETEESEMLICTTCNARVQTVLKMFGGNREVTVH